MRKTVFTLIAVLVFAASAFSQLSTRENDANSIKLGTRPGAGDMALTFGLELTGGGSADLPILNQLTRGDILTFKYYSNEKTAIRLGIKLYKDGESLKGDQVNFAGDFVLSELNSNSSSEYIIVPGLEKHFSPGNIFDVYAGGDLYLGVRRNLLKNEIELQGGNYTKVKETSSPLVLGLGTVVGFNVFIAQLPISLGLEYGINFKWTNQGKSKYTYEDQTDSYEYFFRNGAPGTRYSKLSTTEVGINTNSNVRAVLNIYFGK
jgi:hypothetical protein